MVLVVNRQQVLKLYKELLISAKLLKYTDKDYYKRRVQEAFRENQNVADPAGQERLYLRGTFILENKMGGLL
ncbi:uncharacterized protein EV422DRAFT_567203 [Fimicolochytrium jonesii]|uniref:uncharacterized protein n=1 Tax=Fimicolochytrium jonesii TaxID=1396493 RepID=UPI0022FF3582|nr:uncharacterized protein EV422DRAFT_567203 [Fimicolochytrium jonesii]KAI8821467.1 hypothetical protein EV422DRAFT_567203 [Fimicolochytrium jonesii]